MVKSTEDGYLSTYAEPETKLLGSFPDYQYRHVLVIPAYQESAEFLKQYQKHFTDIHLLIILVVNQPESDDDEVAQLALCNAAQSSEQRWQEEHLALHSLAQHCDVLLVQRFKQTRRIPEKFGVGLARKIGADLALALMLRGNITSPWIACTDADAELPRNYFNILKKQSSNFDALTFDYDHQGANDQLQSATKLYESSLKYYQAGLAWACSRYAFHAIGSCLVVNRNAYAVHRGIPKRPAGEDFYLLNKIAKRGVIKHLTDEPIVIFSRISNRTPFGTGTAVNKIITTKDRHYDYYHPECFVCLKSLLEQLQTLPTQASFEHWLSHLSETFREIMVKLALEKFHTHHHKQGFSQDQLKDEVQCWFDGLKTLQFIHYLRDNHYPDMSLSKALTQAKFLSNSTPNSLEL
ncbi:MAG: hypothetical protein HKP09_09610 [Enterobacterales bacterium]|nr:hypothetical protein [Enterobacterales bacterium]